MKVTILGSGTAIPEPDRFPSGALVQVDGRNLLIDIGPGTLRRLASTGVDLADVDAVLLTHYHTDHTADLAPLLFALHGPRYRGRKPLEVIAAPGLRRFVGLLTEAWPWLSPKDYELRLREIKAGRHEVAGVRFQTLPIRHTAQSLGYRLEHGGAVVAFSGDADECPELAELARGADLFVCDCAFPDELRTEGHLTPSLAGIAAAQAGVRILCLTHFYPECEGYDLRAEAAQTYSGNIVLAEDLMTIEVP